MAVKKAAGKLRSAGNSIEVSIRAKEKITKNIQAKPLRTLEALTLLWTEKPERRQPAIFSTSSAEINSSRSK